MRIRTNHAARPLDLAPAALAAVLATAAIRLGWRGADWPAQLLRIELVEQAGPTIWNNLWFSGHHTPGYGIVFPILAAALGPGLVAVLSCTVAAGCFHLVARGRAAAGRTIAASALFAAGTIVNVAVGRLTFALGLAVGMAALAAVRAGWIAPAAVLALLTAPASPVAGVMLGLALTAWWLHNRRASLLVLAALAVAPVAAAAVLFPQGGQFTLRAGALGWSLAVAAVVAVATGAQVVRDGAVLYAAACVATFLVPNPLGANATRLGMFVAAPVLVLTARRLRQPLVLLALPAMLWWQWSPAVDGIVRAGRDPTASAAYHEPLVAAIRTAGPLLGRVEVVPTQRHWETVYVAAELPMARGWERQLDIGRNPLFYGTELDAHVYHAWLREHAVQFVALADGPVDPSGRHEADLVRRGLPFLEPFWHDEHWQLWRVVDAEPLVEGPARLVEMGSDAMTLDVTADEPVLVRVRYSSHWSLHRPGCVRPSPEGWTVVQLEQPSTVRLRPVLARSVPLLGALDDCAS
jgi:hypothetical protein